MHCYIIYIVFGFKFEVERYRKLEPNPVQRRKQSLYAEMTTLSQDVVYPYTNLRFIPSVINLCNSLDNETRNTRTLETFKINLKRKVVLAKIPGHFLVGDRRSNILNARLRRNCSSLKYDLFRCNIITDSRCVCEFITEDTSNFLLNCWLYI